MGDICRATLGEDAFLVSRTVMSSNSPKSGTKFGWHQDSGYVGHYHRALSSPVGARWTICRLKTEPFPYLPYSAIGMTPDDLYDHEIESREQRPRLAIDGDPPRCPGARCPAGSIVVFSSRTFHRSGPNTTSGMRRCYLAQYSAEPIMNREGTGLWGQAIPILKDGRLCRPQVLEQIGPVLK